MLRSIIIDDEPKNIRILRKLVDDYCPEVEVIAEASDVLEAFESIRANKPDLLFLDIEMPFGNAFDLLDKLQPVNFEVIFITAFNEYALKALKYSALDYLLKPVNIEDLKLAVHKAIERIKSRSTHANLNNLLENLRKLQPAMQKLALPTNEGLVFLPVEKIVRCEAKGSYTIIHTFNEKLVTSRNIKEYEELLPGNIFFRVHNSHIVNINNIKKYYKGRGGYIEMDDGATVEIATRRKDAFLRRIGM